MRKKRDVPLNQKRTSNTTLIGWIHATNRRLRMFLRSNAMVIRFLVLFVVFLLIGYILYKVFYTHVYPFLVGTLHIEVGAHIINIISSGEKVVAQGVNIVSGTSTMQIAKGCEGIDGIILITAAILAFPAGIRKKCIGVVIGILFIYVLNIVRIVGLWFTLKYEPAFFDIMHFYVGQTYIIFFSVLFFIWWSIHGKHAQ